MNKFIVAIVFLFIFIVLFRRDRIYVVPFIYLIYSNINGLLDWEDFALKGVIKLPDYGLILVVFLLMLASFLSPKSKPLIQVKDGLFKFLLVFWFYYFFELLYSIIISGGLEWPVKMGRTFFYGLVMFLMIRLAKQSPYEKFDKIINFLKYATVFFGALYIGYNLLGWEIYPKGEHEEFMLDNFDEIKRNFSGYPSFSFYFLIYFIDQLLKKESNKTFCFAGLVVVVSAIVLTLTRGAILNMVGITAITLLYRKMNLRIYKNVLACIFVGIFLFPAVLKMAPGQLEVITLRFEEFGNGGGAMNSGNFVVRAQEFFNILDNTVKFNPVFGMGFTNAALMGYESSVITNGSADNGFTNLIGVTGFLGLLLYWLVIYKWIRVNLKLQSLKMENYSKINFIYIIYAMISMFNGSTMSYMHNIAIFMIYDMLMLAHFSRKLKLTV